MGKVTAAAAMSLDGYIAKHDNTIGHLFDWLQNGDVECQTATPQITFHLTPQSATYWREWTASLGALICGRTLFDFTDGWGGRHTMDCQSSSSRTTCRPRGSTPTPMRPSRSLPMESRPRWTGRRRSPATVSSPSPLGPSLGSAWNSTCSTRVAVDLVPVVMGEGRPFFGRLSISEVELGDPTTRIQSDRVTHLRLPVRR
jgi:hypothetical protein